MPQFFGSNLWGKIDLHQKILDKNWSQSMQSDTKRNMKIRKEMKIQCNL